MSTVTGEWAQELGPGVLVAQRPRAGQLRRGARPADRRRAHDLRRARPASGARRLRQRVPRRTNRNRAAVSPANRGRPRDDAAIACRPVRRGPGHRLARPLRRAEPAHRAAPLPVAARAALDRGRAAWRQQRLAARRRRRPPAAPPQAGRGAPDLGIHDRHRKPAVPRRSRGAGRADLPGGCPRRSRARCSATAGARAAGGAQDRGRARPLRAGGGAHEAPGRRRGQPLRDPQRRSRHLGAERQRHSRRGGRRAASRRPGRDPRALRRGGRHQRRSTPTSARTAWSTASPSRRSRRPGVETARRSASCGRPISDSIRASTRCIRPCSTRPRTC